MMQKLKNLYALMATGLSLGATAGEKLRLTSFLVASRVLPYRHTMKKFKVQMHGVSVHIRLRSNFADAYILREAFCGDEYALPSVTEPSVIFDLGANLGFVALSFAVRYPHARIFCFEPDPENFAELIANTSAFPNVRSFPYAIGAKNETRSFYKSPLFHMRNSLIAREGNDKRIEVKVITLDEAIAITGEKHIDLMKFDVEGAEAEIFSSFTHFSAIGSLVGEIHPYLWRGDEERQLLEALRKQYRVTLRTERGKTFLAGTAL